jgi:YVTN family beta-propeller protein
MTRRLWPLAALACAALPFAAAADVKPTPKPPTVGPTEGGFLLPNGWTISPAGRQVTLTDLPLNIIPLADGKHALAATSGYNKHELSLVDLQSGRVVAAETVRESWFGLAVDAKQEHVWWSGGGAGLLHAFDLRGTKLTRSSPPDTTPPAGAPPRVDQPAPEGPKPPKPFRSGVALSRDGSTLYSLDVNAARIRALDPQTGSELKSAAVGTRPYDVIQSRAGNRLYVSDWAGRAVLALGPETLRTVAKIPVGEHPNQLALHPTDDRLFVACASSNSVAVIDTKRGVVTETVRTSLFPRSPEGSTPDALALTPDGKTLFVANADNNCVAVIDIEKPGESAVKGFIPTGWYPTAVAVTPDGKSLLVGVGKGNQTKPNPIRQEGAPLIEGETRRRPFPYIGTTLAGALSIVPVPDEKQLAEYTATVYRNCPYSDNLLTASTYDRPTAIPTKVGGPSPIKHVIYIIKENRTYDQVFGDVKKGNGDPALVMFGEPVTPNHHKLANEFVLLDNLYCNGQVSRDGHPWSTMAYHTDYIGRDWHLTYSKRKGVDDDDEGDLTNAPSGYLWDACGRAGLSYRSYGEAGKRVSQPDGTTRIEGRVPGLVGHMCPDYGVAKVKGKKVRDPENVETFLREFREFEKNNNLPAFIVMSLGEDHTTGTTPGTFTPQACVASNDLALGQLVEAVTHSKYWPETAIFVIEDDAQNGPDHVDAHRTAGLVISPYTKRAAVDGTQYSTVSMIRTIELILGLSPLSQYDAAARPMYESFTDRADLTPYTHEPARIDLNALNTRLAYGAARSEKMDFSDYDRVDDWELNEVLWYAVKGPDAPLPPPVRQAIAFRSAPVK